MTDKQNKQDNAMNKFEFLLLFDVQDGNPNGDPANDNMPRMDFETGQGIVSDVCLKRKVRNYIQIVKGGVDGVSPEEGYDIWVKPGPPLNDAITDVVHTIDPNATNTEDDSDENAEDEDKDKKKGKGKKSKNKPLDPKDYPAAQKLMCGKYADVRCFGGVLSTGGSKIPPLTGPYQFTFSRSIDPITTSEVSVTRCVHTTGEDNKERTFGSKTNVNYGLYAMRGYYNPIWAARTGATEADKKLILDALAGGMWEFDRSAGRGTMATRKLIVFQHSSPLGNAPSEKLFGMVHIKKKDGVVTPRSFGDYEVSIDLDAKLEGVEVVEVV